MLGSLCLALAFGLLFVVWLLARPLALLTAAVIVATALEPLVGWLQRWLPRAAAVGLLYLALIVALLALAAIAAPPIISQGEQLVAMVPSIVDRAGRAFVLRLGADRPVFRSLLRTTP